MEKSGWIHVRNKRKVSVPSAWSQQSFLTQSWKKQWVVVRDQGLSVYKDEREYEPVRVVPAEEIMSVALLDDLNFAVFTSSINHHFRCDTTTESESWVTQLKEVGKKAAEGVVENQKRERAARAGGHVEIPIVVDTCVTQGVTQGGLSHHSQLHSYSNHPHSPHMEASHTEYSGDDVFSSQSEWDDERSPCDTKPGCTIPGLQGDAKPGYPPLETKPGLPSGDTIPGHPALDTKPGYAKPGHPDTKPGHLDTKPGHPTLVTSNTPPHSSGPSPTSPTSPPPTSAPPSPSKSSLIAEGPLLRLKKRYNQWQRQYAVLTVDSLSFYKSQSSANQHKKPIKTIPVDQLLDVVELDPLSKSKPFCMQLITPAKRIRFSLDSEGELTKWLVAIKSIAKEDFTR